jgi:hypothetical protein
MPLTCKPNAIMHLVSAFKVDEDLQRAWRGEREEESQSAVESNPGTGQREAGSAL